MWRGAGALIVGRCGDLHETLERESTTTAVKPEERDNGGGGENRWLHHQWKNSGCGLLVAGQKNGGRRRWQGSYR
jgi:hypothetical protein